jgi:hypothetical protein
MIVLLAIDDGSAGCEGNVFEEAGYACQGEEEAYGVESMIVSSRAGSVECVDCGKEECEG